MSSSPSSDRIPSFVSGDLVSILSSAEEIGAGDPRVRNVIHDLSEFVVRWLPDGTRLFVNEAYARYLGAPREELLGTSFFPLMTPAHREAVRDRIARLTPEGPCSTGQHCGIGRDGVERWHEWTDRGFFDDAGQLVELQSTGRIITEQKRAQQEVARQLSFQTVLAELAGAILSPLREDTAGAISAALELVCHHFDLDGADTWWFGLDGCRVSRTGLFIKEGLDPGPDEFTHAEVPWYWPRVRAGQVVAINDVAELPAVAHRARAMCESLGCTAELLVPLRAGEQQVGAGVAVLYGQTREWSQRETEEFQLAMNLIAAFEMHRQAVDEVARLSERLAGENRYLRDELDREKRPGALVGESPLWRAVLRDIDRVASTDATALVLGETGTGKELIARTIHARSAHSAGPIIAVNCATWGGELIDSELFGHVKGAFTGALDERPGCFELAHGGTLFLDEVGELPISTQAKLLRVLEEGRVSRLGGGDERPVDVRIVAATNRDLSEAVASGAFRADLYFRLQVYPIDVPPLRSRPGDIPRLARHLLTSLAARYGKSCGELDDETAAVLTTYHWPGNVRELQNVLERGVIRCCGGTLSASDIRRALGLSDSSVEHEPPHSLDAVQRTHILSVLKATGWRIGGVHGAASVLNLHENTLRSRMKKLGITRPAGD